MTGMVPKRRERLITKGTDQIGSIPYALMTSSRSPKTWMKGGARTSGVIALLRYVVNHTGARGKDSSVQTPNSSLSVRPVVALAWVMARSSALFFGSEKPCAVPLYISTSNGVFAAFSSSITRLNSTG
jgi:hypothetical protein